VFRLANVKCIQTVGANGGTSLHTTDRMNAVHAFLQRGNVVAGSSGDPAFQAVWTETEAEFVKVLLECNQSIRKLRG
jgi:hypothetical protein